MSANKRKVEDISAAPGGSSTPVSAPKRAAFASAAEPNVPIKQEPTEIDTKYGVGIKEEDEPGEEEKYTPMSHLAGLKRDANGHIICPYLDTINRHMLDFDFEKICSVSLATSNVYACLSCGKFFQGRGKNSIAYAHALDVELNHHIFINLATEEIYCLPDGYQVFDPSLDDIKFNLHPKFKQADLDRLDRDTSFIHALDGTDYLPGLVGLNNIKNTDWLNVIIQSLNFIPTLRNFFIVDQSWDRSIKALPAPSTNNGKAASSSSSKTAPSAKPAAAVAAASSASSTGVIPLKSDLALKYAELLAKIWNPRSFKGHVSPHELLQSVVLHSAKQFSIGKFADALQVLSFLLRELHKELGGTEYNPKKPQIKPKPSIITKTFQGEMKVTTEILAEAKADGDAMETDEEKSSSSANSTITVEYRPFRYLSLALPATPLFQDSTDKAIIPQVPLFDLLKRFDGQTVEVDVDPETKRERRRTYSITKLPPYLIIHYQRFANNTFFAEKNPTLVSFPLESLELRPYTSGPNVQQLDSEETVKSMSVTDIKKKLRAKHVPCENIVEKDELVSLLVKTYKNSPPPSTRYDLISNIVHDGKPKQGTYKCHSLHKASHTWYTTEDLHVWTTETMAQQIALSEAYIQIYQKQ